MFKQHFLLALTAVYLLVSPVLQAQPQQRDTVGLVLAGGGARGIAHAGVIRALEEMQIPVDAIAGTSMGALVGGLYATGMDADQLEQIIFHMDWERAFEDSVPRGELPPRRKSDDYDYPTAVNLAFKDGDLSIPLGFVQGQQVRQMIKELMVDAVHIRDFDKLPIPFRAVATDIETGDAYVFAGGSIVTAMRASMSLPGLLEPVEHKGRLLVDGGLANNIPVDVARTMGVKRLIVIDIGTPLKKREDITSMVSVADQILGFLTRKNSLQQLETLTDSDLLIRPDLGPVGMLDFDQQQLIYDRGYAAAQALKTELANFSLDDASWEQYVANRAMPDLGNPPIEFIAIANDSRISDDMIRVRINQPLGETLDRERLLADIAAIYALDYWEIIDYETQRDERGSGLLIKATAKSWGEDRLRLGLNLLSDLDGASEFNIGTSYLLKGVNRLGGEVYGRAQIGHKILLSGEFYQPLDLRSRFFVVPYIGYTDSEVLTLGPEYDITEVLGKWRVRQVHAELATGANLGASSQFRAGLSRGFGNYRVDLSTGVDLIEDDFEEGGGFVSYRFDTLDNAFFPTEGTFLFTEYEWQRAALGADSNFERWQLYAQSAFTFGSTERNTVIFTGRTGQSYGAENQPQNYYQLGGLFNLSGLSQNFYSGRQMAFVMGQYQRRLSDNSVIPLDMPVYAGFSIEGGQVWSQRSDIDVDDLTLAGSLYLAVDSPLGPLYLAYGHADGGSDAVYLSLGWPFLTGGNRVGR